jgi:hypothetical protein
MLTLSSRPAGAVDDVSLSPEALLFPGQGFQCRVTRSRFLSNWVRHAGVNEGGQCARRCSKQPIAYGPEEALRPAEIRRGVKSLNVC